MNLTKSQRQHKRNYEVIVAIGRISPSPRECLTEEGIRRSAKFFNYELDEKRIDKIEVKYKKWLDWLASPASYKANVTLPDFDKT